MDTRRLNDVTPAEWDKCKGQGRRNATTMFETLILDEAEAYRDNVEYDEDTEFFGSRSVAPFGETPSGNPKKRLGALKAPMHLIPPVASAHLAIALADGAAKYGAFNYRSEEVNASTYVGACYRHLALWMDGEDAASDSGVNHIACAMASCAILLDCMAAGKLVDDRPPSTSGVSDLFEDYHKGECR